MKQDVKIEKVDESWVRVLSEDFGILQEIRDHFSFYAAGYKWSPKFKSGQWDGQIRLLNIQTRKLPYGLVSDLTKFCNSRNYSYELENVIEPKIIPSKEMFQYVRSLHITDSKGVSIEPRDYQVEAVCNAIGSRRLILQSPTASGKSLMIYMIARYFMDHCDESKKILVVVPTTSLVSQMQGDFLDYSKNDTEFSESDMHMITGGKEKSSCAKIYISTWQSIFKQPKKWFDQFGIVFGDEAHQYAAQSLSAIMGNLSQAEYRIGTTGTIPENSKVNKLSLVGHFGPIYQVTTTKKLMDKGTIASLKIQNLILKYTEGEKKAFKQIDYQKEIDYLVGHVKRNAFIRNLALNLKGNTLVLFNYVEKHGKPLYEDIAAHAGETQKVFYVSGEVKTIDREETRKIVEGETNAIICASLGCFSTGINLRNLHNIVFASPTKSQIRVLQSIGRGLRKSDNGQDTTLYDIVDDLSWKKRKNYALLHGIERSKIYLKEQFRVKTHIIDL